MRRTDIAYLAGIFDGEGCISISKHKAQRDSFNDYFTLRIMVKMANPYIPKLFQFGFGGSYLKQKSRPNRRECWGWTATANNAINCLKVLLPFLRLKRDEALLAIEFQGGKHRGIYPREDVGNKKLREAFILEETQAILMHKLKDKSVEK